ncbi:rod shape-determining protein RodA [Kordiimonas sediminis]|uniref:Peptidoglycan glycosyltransferase MrdB n=1 Tax=Kordiimonas sediminis TaxID=1735581 RepID=A0A919AZE5_9PROT|nr:rod shape-determining protein RodA [Kordiimonas sediminis]GHF30603.1 rod shape-determining protein RodA [Kordiimonas sediminis]
MVQKSLSVRRVDRNIFQKFIGLNWFIVLTNIAIAGAGLVMLYSVAGGSWEPWAAAQSVRLAMGVCLMLMIAVTDIRIWMALAYPAWVVGVAMLLAVEVIGAVGMGGQRWLDIGFMRIQPSELMKIAVVLALARYFHGRDFYQSRRLVSLVFPAVLLIVPMILVVRQPDLGTSLMIVAGGAAVLFLAGLPAWLFVSAGVVVAAAIPIGWQFLHDYQKNRVLTFLNPESDPLGAGYQITQSKIALGSGGMTGKGFLQGTQSQLNFLPEMKTDFIFTVLAEEFGLIGAVILLSLYTIVLLYGLLIGIGTRSQFGRLLASGLSITLFLYVLINVAMVMGLMPVVGVPLPMVSWGGSAMLTWLIAYGLILSVATHRQVTLAPKGSGLA